MTTMSSNVVSRSTLTVVHTPAQASAWFDVAEIANEIDRLRTLRLDPQANVGAINARIDTMQAQLTANLRAYAQA